MAVTAEEMRLGRNGLFLRHFREMECGVSVLLKEG
jgi:hypothetical protein